MPDADSENGWDAYLSYGERQFFQRKSTIYCENEEGMKGFYYLKKGMVKISTITHAGEERIIDLVCNGTPFGEQAVDGTYYFSTASAIEDSIIYHFLYDDIKMVMATDEAFRLLIYTSLMDKLRTLSNNVVSYSLPAEKILARTILRLKSKFVSKYIPFTQLELSRYTNINRITVYNTFKKWDDNVVSLHNKNITVHDMEALKRIASD